jgi:DNA-binding PucR family transcriptional regulator
VTERTSRRSVENAVVGVIPERVVLRGQESEAGDPFEALADIARHIHAEEFNAEAIFRLIVEHARELVGADLSWMTLLDEQRQRLRVKVSSGENTAAFRRMGVRLGHGLGGLALAQQRTVVVRDYSRFDNRTPASVRRAVLGEGLVSLICAPMLHGGAMIGALYAGSRTPRDFTDVSASLLTALASQAAIAIVNSRLYQTLAEKNDMLERTFALHRALTDASLAGAGLEQLGSALAGSLARDLAIVTTDGAATHHKRYLHDGTEASVETIPLSGDDFDLSDSFPIVAGDERLGEIRALGPRPLSGLEAKALEQGATVIALEIMKERAALEVEWRLRGELLEQILQAHGKWSEGLRLRAERLGVALEEARRLVVLLPQQEPRPAALLDLARSTLRDGELGRTSLVAQRADEVLIAFPSRGIDSVERVKSLLAKASEAGIAAVAGVSRNRTSLNVALREAEAAARLARGAATGTVISHDDLGPLRFLFDAPDTSEMLSMVADLLGPLIAYDRRRSGGLLQTLRVYL